MPPFSHGRAQWACLALALAFPGCTDYLTIEVDGREREYLVHAPDGDPPAAGWPVLFVFHGAFMTGASMQKYVKIDGLADDEGFVVVYPNGIHRVWNDGRVDSEVDDIAFTDALLDRIDRDFEIDADRVYATGISNGAFMSHRVACDLSDRFVGAAPVAGTLSEELRDTCEPQRPMPMLLVMGTEDDLVPYEGGELGGGLSGELGTMLSAVDSAAWWAEQSGCGAARRQDLEKVEDGTSIELRAWAACDGDVQVQLYTVDGGGHTWPGAKKSALFGTTSREIDANEVLWAFFSGFSLPAGP